MHNHDREPVSNIKKEQVSCEVCLNSIPVSEAKSEEATDYVAHFCGLNCYNQWKDQALDNKVA